VFYRVVAVGDGYGVGATNASGGFEGKGKGTTRISLSGSYVGIIILNGNGSVSFKPDAANGKRGANIACGRAEISSSGYGELCLIFVAIPVLYLYIVGAGFGYGHIKGNFQAAVFIRLGCCHPIVIEVDGDPALVAKTGTADGYLIADSPRF